MAGTNIDFGDIRQPALPQQPWKAPRHIHFGPKNPETGQMEDEPVYEYKPYPAMRYKPENGAIRASQVNTEAEELALGDGWYDSPAKFGAITAPTFEQSRLPPPKLTQPK